MKCTEIPYDIVRGSTQGFGYLFHKLSTGVVLTFLIICTARPPVATAATNPNAAKTARF